MQIARFSVHQTSKVAAIVYFCISVLFLPLFFVMAFLDPGTNQIGAAAGFFVLAPFFYAVVGYVFTALACAIYNFVAKRTGGIEFTTVGESL